VILMSASRIRHETSKEIQSQRWQASLTSSGASDLRLARSCLPHLESVSVSLVNWLSSACSEYPTSITFQLFAKPY
jgi:hypothetical protein